MSVEAGGPDPALSVVIPVYRSERTLEALHERLTRVLEDLVSSHELIFVDDDSPDHAWQVLESLRARDPRVRLIQLSRNFGQQRAVLCGLAASRGEVVVTMDDDLQQRPEEIPILYEALVKGDSDVVIGRFLKKQHGWLRSLGTAGVRRLAALSLDIPPDLEWTSFRALRGDVARRVAELRNPNPVVGFLISKVTRHVVNVEVHHEKREHGQSNYSRKALVDYFIAMLMDYSEWPLRAFGYFGVALSLGSFAVGLYTLASFSFGRIGVSGFTTLALLITFLSGAILMGLSIASSYLVRILRQMGDPASVSVRRRIG